MNSAKKSTEGKQWSSWNMVWIPIKKPASCMLQHVTHQYYVWFDSPTRIRTSVCKTNVLDGWTGPNVQNKTSLK